MRKIKIVIVDDDICLCELLSTYIKEHCSDFLEIIGMTHDGNRGIEMIKNVKPDAVILDVALPWRDGITVMPEIRNNAETENIICIMVSAMGSGTTLQEAMGSGCDYFYVKPFDFTVLTKKIESLYEAKEGNRFRIYNDFGNKISEPEPKIIMENLSKLLFNTGVRNMNGSFYQLRHSINLCISDKSLLDSVTKQLYPAVAKEFRTSGSRVEHSIRYLLKKSWDQGAGALFAEMTGLPEMYVEKKPTNSMFIRQMVEIYEKNYGRRNN